jgi:hypothetical protein
VERFVRHFHPGEIRLHAPGFRQLGRSAAYVRDLPPTGSSCTPEVVRMADLADVGKALFGDDESEVVKSGTLAVTRLTGWVGAAGLALTNSDALGSLDLTDSTKLWGSISIVAVFAFIASADAIARAYVTGQTQPDVRTLPTPMAVKIPAKFGADERGWHAILVRFTPQNPDDLDFWVVKGETAEWVKGSDLKPA